MGETRDLFRFSRIANRRGEIGRANKVTDLVAWFNWPEATARCFHGFRNQGHRTHTHLTHEVERVARRVNASISIFSAVRAALGTSREQEAFRTHKSIPAIRKISLLLL